MNTILVRFSMVDIRKKAFPDSRFVPARIQSLLFILPMFKIPQYTNRFCVGSPDGKIRPLITRRMDDMRTKLPVKFVVLTRLKEVDIKVCEQREAFRS